MWKRSLLILVTNWHKTSRSNICLLENRNLWTFFKAPNSKRRLSEPILPIFPYRFHYSLQAGVSVLLGPYRSSVIEFFLGYSEIGFPLGSSIKPLVIRSSLGYSVIGSSLESLVIGSSLGSS